MFIVLRKSSVKRSLAIAIFLIMAGVALIKPWGASASTDLLYLYPAKQNNPTQIYGHFWAESAPEIGSYTLNQWLEAFPDKRLVVGVPDDYTVGAGFVGKAWNRVKLSFDQPRTFVPGDRLGKYLTGKFTDKNDNGKGGGGGKQIKDVLVLKRETEIDGAKLKEEIKLEVGEHFKDNDKFDKYVDTIKNKLQTDPATLKTNAKKSFWDTASNKAEANKITGTTLVLAGLYIAFRILVPIPVPF